MTSLIFVSTNDLSKTSGSGVATREIVRAIGSVTTADLCVICPDPAETLSTDLRAVVDRFRFLPAETNPGHPLWHAKIETALGWHLLAAIRVERPAAVVTRLAQSTLFPAPICRALSIPYLLMVRGVVNRDDEYDRTKLSAIVEQVVRLNVSLADEVTVAFEAVREAIGDYRRLDQSHIEIVPNAVDPERFTPVNREEARVACEADLPPDTFVLGFVGTLAERQMLPALFRALSDVPDVHLLVVGSGPVGDRLRTLTADLTIESQVTFVGQVPYNAVPTYIGACDAAYGVVNPKRPSNPIKVYEYLACERPVLTSRSPEMTFVEHKNAGVVIEEVTPAAVADAVRELRDSTPNRRREMGVRGREYVLANHTWATVARRVLPDTLQRPRAHVEEAEE
ncbi:glycosyltransferase family 4 protein [Halosimplex rubrum]|uniref:Glycosyltransferase family 4 protein n=1 Tax=Halosimplex rubrum TaxID=869889 RepID=A0A7D5NZF5_9EURY|nr:glycosyltransferase family 4 protein [Halosimplex rubrum]QLH76837.1 glycosyltransferase family 4 protein [Halosimplex rubrum]